MQSLCTLRTPRRRDARNTRYRAARYALPGRDLHPLDHASFAWRTVWWPHFLTRSLDPRRAGWMAQAYFMDAGCGRAVPPIASGHT